MSAKYDTWVNLNTEGVKAYGHIFPDGIVPIKSALTQVVEVDGNPCSIYEFDLSQFSDQQRETCIKASATALCRTEQELDEYFKQDGVMYIMAAFVLGSPFSRI